MNSSKDLNKLVDDIYESIAPLSEGKNLNLPEDLIEDFGERIKSVITNWSKPKEQTKGLRMSNIGRPARQLWYDSRNDNTNSIPSATQIKFLYGHILEELLLLLVKLSGHELSDEQ